LLIIQNNIFIIILLLINVIYIFSICLLKKNIIIIINTFLSILPSKCLLLFLAGFLGDIFYSSNENVKTILLNNGGSPKIIFKWSQLSLPRYVIFSSILGLIFLIDHYNNNILNTAFFISVDKNYNLKYTYGLILLYLILVIFVVRFSIIGNKLNGLFKLFFCLEFFKFFLGGDKLPGVFQKNHFIDVNDSNWFLIKKIDNKEYLITNNKEESKCLLLPIHLYFFGLGRVLQVLLRILFLVIGLLFLMLLIFTLFNLIFNYINCLEYGDNHYSLFSLVKKYFNLDSITTAWHSSSITSNIIVPKQTWFDVVINVFHNLISAATNKYTYDIDNKLLYSNLNWNIFYKA